MFIVVVFVNMIINAGVIYLSDNVVVVTVIVIMYQVIVFVVVIMVLCVA